MKKYIVLLMGLIHCGCFSADYSILECKGIGMVPSQNHANSAEKSNHGIAANQAAINILKVLREAMIQYPKLDIEQKKKLFIALSSGLRNNFHNSEIGSGNIVLFWALSKIRNYIIADLLKGGNDYISFILKTAPKETNVQLTKEQLNKMLSNEFGIKNQDNNLLQSEIILNIIPDQKNKEASKSRPYVRFIPSFWDNTPRALFKNFFQLLENTDAKGILQIYSIAEIENAVAFSVLSLQQIQKENQTLENTYLTLRNNMNPLQIETFGFDSGEYKTGDSQISVIDGLKSLTETFLSSLVGHQGDFKFRLKIEE
ncbi:MAG: hypothetical protein PHE87_07770 [Victivallaceae bacterium]|nr:hypothetical protein [Victivallaceae bacterium]